MPTQPDANDLGVMKRFRNILIVAGLDDGSIPGYLFDRALSLARRNEAKLTLVDVVSTLASIPGVPTRELSEAVLTGRREALVRLAAGAQAEGVKLETELVVGRPFIEITRRVLLFGHDLVMTDGGRGEAAGGLMDSTTMHLMRKCPCAIWVARPRPTGRYTRILAAVDPDPVHPENDSINRKIMELAVSLARFEASELHVVHVWELYGMPVGASGEIWKQWEETARTVLKQRLCDFLAEYDVGSDPLVHLVGGKPALAISRLAAEEEIDLLVMGTVCRTGIRGFFIGNTAEGVLRRVDCSLLTVKPEGFVSPVESSLTAGVGSHVRSHGE